MSPFRHSRLSRLLHRRLVDHRLDVVAVRVEHEAGVVILGIVRTPAGRTIVFGSGRQRCPMERIDLCLAADAESDVQMGERWRLAGSLDLEQAAIADIESPEYAFLAEDRR